MFGSSRVEARQRREGCGLQVELNSSIVLRVAASGAARPGSFSDRRHRIATTAAAIAATVGFGLGFRILGPPMCTVTRILHRTGFLSLIVALLFENIKMLE